MFASFSSRGIFAYSLDGQLRWQVDLGDMQTRFGWGEAVTPVIADDKLIVNWDQEKGSFITALEASSGKPLWRVERPEEATSWNTPLVVKDGTRTLVVVNGTHRVKAYDAANGQEVWLVVGKRSMPFRRHCSTRTRSSRSAAFAPRQGLLFLSLLKVTSPIPRSCVGR